MFVGNSTICLENLTPIHNPPPTPPPPPNILLVLIPPHYLCLGVTHLWLALVFVCHIPQYWKYTAKTVCHELYVCIIFLFSQNYFPQLCGGLTTEKMSSQQRHKIASRLLVDMMRNTMKELQFYSCILPKLRCFIVIMWISKTLTNRALCYINKT